MRSAGVIGALVLAAGCGDYGRTGPERRALKVANDANLDDRDALLAIAGACAGELPVPASLDRADGRWLSATVAVDREIHRTVIDKHGELGSMRMNVQGWQRQLAMQAVCMMLAGEQRGLTGVHLTQHLGIPGIPKVSFEIRLSREQLATVPNWSEATFDSTKRWATYDGTFAAADVAVDNTTDLQLIEFEL